MMPDIAILIQSIHLLIYMYVCIFMRAKCIRIITQILIFCHHKIYYSPQTGISFHRGSKYQHWGSDFDIELRDGISNFCWCRAYCHVRITLYTLLAPLYKGSRYE